MPPQLLPFAAVEVLLEHQLRAHGSYDALPAAIRLHSLTDYHRTMKITQLLHPGVGKDFYRPYPSRRTLAVTVEKAIS
jgi:hypothetical protein